MRKCNAKNKIILTTVFLLVFILTIFIGCKKDQPQEAQQTVKPQKTEPSEKIALSILYAGLLETERAKDFVAFLAAHFEKVGTTDYLTFKETESACFDVTIIDHDGVDFDRSIAIFKLSCQYAHPVIAVGVPGANICSQLLLKTAYL